MKENKGEKKEVKDDKAKNEKNAKVDIKKEAV